MTDGSSKKKQLIAGAALLLIVVVVAAVYVQNSQQPSTAAYSPQTKVKTATSTGQSGGVVDNNQNASQAGASAATPAPTTSSISSANDIITLTSPAANAIIGNNTAISGTASGLAKVDYRIEDSLGRVIVTGPLIVTNGTFSGTIQGLEAGSKIGSFEVFDYQNRQGGAEENDIKIDVGFQ